MDDPDTQNLYGYCAENPVNYVDPSGHGREVSMSQVVKALRICTDGTIKNKYEKNYCIHKKGKKDGPYNDKNHQCKTTAFPTNSSKKNKMSKIASDEIPYIVVPPGDKPYIYGIGVIENINTGDYLYCIIADVGPKMLGKKKNGLGEVSIYAAWKMKKMVFHLIIRRFRGIIELDNQVMKEIGEYMLIRKLHQNQKQHFVDGTRILRS